jgi:chromatin remodeling complex protein RSC6
MRKVTGEEQLPRPQVVKKIWDYIKVGDVPWR